MLARMQNTPRSSKGLTPKTIYKVTLLIVFRAPVEARRHLGFGDHEQAVVFADFNRLLGAQLALIRDDWMLDGNKDLYSDQRAK